MITEQEDDLETLGNQDIEPKAFERYAELCEQGAQEQYEREQQEHPTPKGGDR